MPKYMRKKAYIFVYLMLAISFIGMIKYIYINIQSILLAFSIENVETHERTYTLLNFETFFIDLTKEGNIQIQSLINTIKYFVMYLVKNTLSFVVSFFFFKKIKGYKFYRFLFYLPCIVSPIVLVYSYIDVLKVYGPVYQLLNKLFGVEYRELLSYPETATNTILAFCFWSGFGTDLLIFVGAMNRIPSSIIDAERIDGCGMGKEFFKIVLPLVWETFSTIILLNFVGIFLSSGPILFFTGGDSQTNTISFWVFNEVRGHAYNYPAAVGLFYTIAAIPIVIIVKILMSLFNSDVSY